jgi:hypothetical protein
MNVESQQLDKENSTSLVERKQYAFPIDWVINNGMHMLCLGVNMITPAFKRYEELEEHIQNKPLSIMFALASIIAEATIKASQENK